MSVCDCCTSLIKCRCSSSTRDKWTPIHYLMENENKVDAEFLKTIEDVAPGALAAVDGYA